MVAGIHSLLAVGSLPGVLWFTGWLQRLCMAVAGKTAYAGQHLCLRKPGSGSFAGRFICRRTYDLVANYRPGNYSYQCIAHQPGQVQEATKRYGKEKCRKRKQTRAGECIKE